MNQSVDSNFVSRPFPDESKRRKEDQNPRGDGVALECCLMEKSMCFRAPKGGSVFVCVWGY